MALRADDIDALRADDIDMSADRTLIEQYQAGDGRAFDELYGRYSDRLRSFCQRKVGDHHAAEEIAQDAFVKALTALPRFAGDMRFYPWLSVIASRLCVDHFRRLGRVRPSDEIDLGVVAEDLGRDLVHQDEIADLDTALGRITERHRTVLELRERRGLSYAEIADDLAVPQTTVETLLFRARKALRREYLAVSGEPSRLPRQRRPRAGSAATRTRPRSAPARLGLRLSPRRTGCRPPERPPGR